MNAYARLLIRDRLLELAGRPGTFQGFRIVAAAPRPPADLNITREIALLAAEQAVMEGRS